MPVNNDAPPRPGCKEKRREKSREKVGREGAENPGFDGDDETTTCLAMVKSSSLWRGTALCSGRLSTDVFLRQIVPPSPPSRLFPSSSSSSSSRNEDPEFVRARRRSINHIDVLHKREEWIYLPLSLSSIAIPSGFILEIGRVIELFFHDEIYICLK